MRRKTEMRCASSRMMWALVSRTPLPRSTHASRTSCCTRRAPRAPAWTAPSRRGPANRDRLGAGVRHALRMGGRAAGSRGRRGLSGRLQGATGARHMSPSCALFEAPEPSPPRAVAPSRGPWIPCHRSAGRVVLKFRQPEFRQPEFRQPACPPSHLCRPARPGWRERSDGATSTGHA
jgi:hypothetical protein